MTLKAAVFCHNGLGDGILSLVVSHNLHQNGWDVSTYHNGMQNLQSWFPHLPIIKYPQEKEVASLLETMDQLILFHNDSNTFVLKLMEEGKKKYPDKVKVIYPYPTQGIRLRPYYQDSYLDPTKPIVKGLKIFCSEMLNLTKTSLNNGFIAPLHLIHRKYENRVALHINSSRPGKNWDIEKYVKLALHLKNSGFKPVFLAGSKEDRKPYLWLEKQGWELPLFSSLSALTEYLYESGYLIGNDSGLGHLASCMKVPTVTISRRKAVARFWQPSLTLSKIVVPYSFIPNIGGFRLRDRKWKKFISAKRVFKKFMQLLKEEKELQDL